MVLLVSSYKHALLNNERNFLGIGIKYLRSYMQGDNKLKFRVCDFDVHFVLGWL